MATIETQNKKIHGRKNLQRLVLDTVATAGVLSAALIAPNTISAIKKLGLLPSRRQRESINAARNRLIQKGFLERDKKGFLRLTEKGTRVLKRVNTLEKGLPKQKRWDGKWRVLIFDIPNHRKGLRAKLRQSLRAVGFVLLQDSVWIYPHNCEDFIALLKTDFKIGKDMLYLIAESIEGEKPYLEKFGLKRR